MDPSGFEFEDPSYDDNPEVQRILAAGGCRGRECQRPPPPPEKTVEGTREAVQVGATTRPVDVSTTGSAAGHVPQSAAAVAAGPMARPVAVQIGAGILKSVWGFANSIADVNTPQGQFRTALGIVQNAVEGARVGGVLGGVAGGLNTLNPLYALAVSGLETKAGIDTGNYERAAGAATTGVLIIGAAVVGGRGGGTAEGTTTFYRGMTWGEAQEAIAAQGLSAERILANQTQNPGAAGSGAYLTSQAATAEYYADLAGYQNRGLGPAVVRIDVPSAQFSAFAESRGIRVETPIPRGPFPGATETLIPPEHIFDFNGMGTFTIHF